MPWHQSGGACKRYSDPRVDTRASRTSPAQGESLKKDRLVLTALDRYEARSTVDTRHRGEGDTPLALGIDTSTGTVWMGRGGRSRYGATKP